MELREQGFGIHFVNYFTEEISQLVGFSYVDDCNTVQLDDDIEATHSQMQLTLSEWEYFISITGGCLALDKSSRYLVYYEWRIGKCKFTNSGQDKLLEYTNKAGGIFPLRYLQEN